MGKMRNCIMRNPYGKMRNDKCGTTVIGEHARPQLTIPQLKQLTTLCLDVAVVKCGCGKQTYYM